MSELILHPEQRELNEKIRVLKNELTDLICERDHLLHTVAPNVEAVYIKEIGALKITLIEKEHEYLRLKRKIEALQACINRGEKADLEKIESVLDDEMKKWVEEIEKLNKELEKAKNHFNGCLSPEDSAELKLKYREIAKLLHPDVNPSAFYKNKNLWLRASEAYENGDVDEIRRIFLLLEKEPQEIPAMDVLSDSKKKIAALEKHIKAVKADIGNATLSYPLKFIEILENPEILGVEKEKIKDNISAYELRIKELNFHLSNLLVMCANEQHN